MILIKNAFLKPFRAFYRLQAAGSVLLLCATVVALVWANSPWGETYEALWHTPITLGFGPLFFRESLHFWINDGLMALFFLIVGLEIKRELLVGELSSPRKAALPIIAALGGLLVPALIYLLFNPPGSPYQKGWGIPTVTDIAFAIGVLFLLGSRVPLGLKVFLTALAIADDLGAILIIALFYSGGINVMALVAAMIVLVALFALNRMEIDRPLPYALLGTALWICFLKSGIHPTVAGVLHAFSIPAQSRIDPEGFYQASLAQLHRFRRAGTGDEPGTFMLTNAEHHASVQVLENLVEEVQTPLQQLEHLLQPWVNLVILPLFALANAGVRIETGNIINTLMHPLALGILLGLFVGKQIGITLFAWLSVRLKLADLPTGVTWSQIHAVSILGGIGFTMSIFITLLAFEDPTDVAFAKLGILIASTVSAIIGCLMLNKTLKTKG